MFMKPHSLSRSFVQFSAATALLTVLVACGGGGVQFPVDIGIVDNQQAAQKAIAKAAPVLDGIAVAYSQSGVLPATNEQAKLPAPDSFADGALRSVQVNNGGAVVASVTRLATAPSASKAADPIDHPGKTPLITNGVYKLIWVAYPAAPGIIRWYCFGDYPEVEADTQGVCKFPTGLNGGLAKGTTWGTYGPGLVSIHGGTTPDPATTGAVTVSCNVTNPPTHTDRGSALNMCDPYLGDWHVLRRLPLLCVKPGAEPPPPVAVPGWTGGSVAVTRPVYGVQLIGLAAADNLCQQEHGEGWRMASHHDNPGGWLFTAKGNTPTDTRFWVLIRNNQANAWCGLGTGFDCTTPPR